MNNASGIIKGVKWELKWTEISPDHGSFKLLVNGKLHRRPLEEVVSVSLKKTLKSNPNGPTGCLYYDSLRAALMIETNPSPDTIKIKQGAKPLETNGLIDELVFGDIDLSKVLADGEQIAQIHKAAALLGRLQDTLEENELLEFTE